MNHPGNLLLSTVLGVVLWATAWLVVSKLTALPRLVFQEQEPESRWRLGGFLAAAALIAGWTVTGVRFSWPALWVDLKPGLGYFAILLLIAVLSERKRAPQSGPPSLLRGPFVAIAYLALAAVVLFWRE